MIRWTVARRAALFILLAAFGSTAARGQQPGSQTTGQGVAGARRDAHVIMISIDGLVPEYYTDPGRLGLRVPNLIRMKLDGAYAEGVEGVYPSVTYPAHTTLVTGVRPAAHGIIQNRIFEAPTDAQTREWYWFSEALKSDTLWTIAKKAGFVTAGVGWPVTVGSNLDYNVPEIVDPKEDPPTPKRTLQHATPGLIQAALSETERPGRQQHRRPPGRDQRVHHKQVQTEPFAYTPDRARRRAPPLRPSVGRGVENRRAYGRVYRAHNRGDAQGRHI